MFEFFFRHKHQDATFWLFLDVDGVLNCKQDWRYQFQLNRRNVQAFQAAYASLQKICKPSIILSSSWRRGWNASNQPNFLKELCRAIPISGRTPISASGNRGQEIERYIARHGRPHGFVAIDDDPSGLARIPSIIIPSEIGFREADGKRLIEFAEKHLKKSSKGWFL